MAVFPIRRFGDPVLRRAAAEVAKVDDAIRKLIRDMNDTMLDAPGVGLAAPQIGVSKRVIVWSHEEEQGALVNARVLERRGNIEAEEACLSLPGLVYPVTRAEWIRVEGLNEFGDQSSFEKEGFVARIIQHEVDHIDGILFIDRLPPKLQREARRVLREQATSGAELPRSGAPL
jgi:peptide deformylase